MPLVTVVTVPEFSPAALARARRRAGLTVAALGAKVGREASVVARYERGEINPPAGMLGRLAGALSVKVDDLFEMPRA
jgi:transcriptional regulator with XRE-family HTH domain